MSEIVHKGIVRKLENEHAEVEIIDGMVCESCSAKGACQVGEVRDKLIRVKDASGTLQVGEAVEVELTTSMAFGALFWAYIFPFILLMLGLIIAINYVSELLAAGVGLGFLVVYYLLVYLNQKYFDKKFELKINRLNHD